MVNSRQIVDDLRSLVNGSNNTLTDRMRQLAIDYEAACREANDRLRRCEDFLQKGLRSEAVHLAEIEPPLLELVGILDFPERSQWEQLTAIYGLAAPTRLLLPTAEALNQAYSREHSLENILQRHRRLALAHAPLNERLYVLRLLFQADPGNPVWHDDIRTFEKVRLEQIRSEANLAALRQDGTLLTTLMQELNNSPWQERPPVSLVEQIQECARRGIQQHAWNQLGRIAADLQAAYSTRDAQRTAALRAEWEALIEPSGIVPSDSLFSRVKPIFLWLDQLHRQQDTYLAYQLALEKLEQALALCSSVESLQELYYELKRFKRPIPAALTQRYKERISSLNIAANRRERYILAATFFGGILALIGFFIFLRTRH